MEKIIKISNEALANRIEKLETMIKAILYSVDENGDSLKRVREERKHAQKIEDEFFGNKRSF